MDLVKDTHPELRKEWACDLNPDQSFDEIRSRSATLVWWRCSKNPLHIWQAHIRRRAIDGNGCPFCSGLKVIREESLAALFPKIAEEWHPTKNVALQPWQVGPKSNRRVWWQCLTPLRHEWQACIKSRVTYHSGCRKCSSIKTPLDSAFPKIAAEWHPTKNGQLTPNGVSAGSRIQVWWQCSKTSTHEWKAAVSGRTRAKSQCPKCRRTANKRKSITLDQYDPILAAQWHHSKNGELSPSDVFPNTNQKVWWICPADSTHEWEALIGNRAKRGTGCPICAPRSRHVTPERSFAARYPELALEMHPEMNNGLKPEEILPGSSRRVWWRCKTDSSHIWEGSVGGRTGKYSKGRCPFCSGHFVTDKNSLRGNHPEIAKEWHPVKNLPLTADTISRASGKKVWWVCSEYPEHEWETNVKSRTILKTGCPQCDVENRNRRFEERLWETSGSNIDPHSTFIQSLASLRSLLNQTVTGRAHVKQSFFRMIYTGGVTALETYLSDTFFKRVINSNEMIQRLLMTTPEFQDRKYSLSEVLEWQSATRDKVSEFLFGITWHNLRKVRLMYRTMFNVEFPEDCGDVFRAVLVRHDLVHRNGRMKDGGHHRFSLRDVTRVVVKIENFVSAIELNLSMKNESHSD